MHCKQFATTAMLFITLLNHASPPQSLAAWHQELIGHIYHCNPTAFKAGYAVFKEQCKDMQDKRVTLELFDTYAHNKQAEKIATLDRIKDQRIQNKACFYKALAQGAGAAFFGFASIIAIQTGFFDTEFARMNEHETRASRCATLIVVPMTFWFAYLTKDTLHRALHYSDIIKQDLQALDEIITFINQETVRLHV